MCYILFQLDTPVNAKGPVELWLLDLLKMQQSSLHCVIRAAFYQISDPGYQLLNFLYHFPAQVRNLKNNWCSIVQLVFKHKHANRLNLYANKSIKSLEKFTLFCEL